MNKKKLISQLLDLKNTIERAYNLQMNLDSIDKSLEINEKNIQKVEDKLRELSLTQERVEKKVQEAKPVSGCLSRLFIFSGLIMGGVIGTMIIPVVGTVIFAILFVLVFSKMDDFFQNLLDCIFPKRREKRKLKGINYWFKEIEDVNSNKLNLENRLSNLYKEMSNLLNNKKELVFNIKKDVYSIEKNDLLSLEYCEPAVIDRLIQIINSGRADTIKESLNLYEDELHKEIMIQLQEEQIKLGHRLTEQQAKILKQQIRHSKQLRYGNILNTVNTVRHWSKDEVHIKFKTS